MVLKKSQFDIEKKSKEEDKAVLRDMILFHKERIKDLTNEVKFFFSLYGRNFGDADIRKEAMSILGILKGKIKESREMIRKFTEELNEL